MVGGAINGPYNDRGLCVVPSLVLGGDVAHHPYIGGPVMGIDCLSIHQTHSIQSIQGIPKEQSIWCMDPVYDDDGLLVDPYSSHGNSGAQMKFDNDLFLLLMIFLIIFWSW